MRQIRYVYRIGTDAFYTFLADDGWAIASHIALSALMALFPFLIVLTSLGGFLGSKGLADQAAEDRVDMTCLVETFVGQEFELGGEFQVHPPRDLAAQILHAAL